LGSGGGKVVLAASMMFPFAKTVGIEKLEKLCEAARRATFRLIQLSGENKLPQIEFRCQNFLEADFTDASVIFINSTCLPAL
jgi:hypothetical protein